MTDRKKSPRGKKQEDIKGKNPKDVTSADIDLYHQLGFFVTDGKLTIDHVYTVEFIVRGGVSDKAINDRFPFSKKMTRMASAESSNLAFFLTPYDFIWLFLITHLQHVLELKQILCQADIKAIITLYNEKKRAQWTAAECEEQEKKIRENLREMLDNRDYRKNYEDNCSVIRFLGFLLPLLRSGSVRKRIRDSANMIRRHNISHDDLHDLWVVFPQRMFFVLLRLFDTGWQAAS